jgi:hypothetical protein
VGGGPGLDFEGFGGGSRCVGDPIWVLGVSGGGSLWVGDLIWVLGVLAVGRGGWGTRSGFWGLRGCGYQVGVSGLMVTACCRGLAMVAKRGRREINGFFFF